MKRISFPSSLPLVLFVLFFLSVTGAAASPPEEPQLVTFPNPGPQVLGDLAAAGWDIWEVTPERVTAQLMPNQINALPAFGIDAAPTEVGTSYGPRFPACYRSFTNGVQQLQNWADAYPDLTELIDAGASWETVQGRASRRLWTLRITNKNIAGPKPSMFLVALHHAREIATPEVALNLAELLLTQYGEDAEITWLVDHHELWVMPFANPDGHILAENLLDWRKNANDSVSSCAQGTPPNSFGVDLNRNYDSGKWGEVGASSNPCNLTYHGPAGFSEPETQAIRDLVQAHKFDLVISLHSYSDLVLYPWGYTSDPPPDVGDLHALASVLASFNGYVPEQGSDLYLTSGDTCDWVYGEEQIPCLTFEIGGFEDGYFWPDCLTMEEQWEENRDALLYALKLAAAPYEMARAPVVRQIQLQQQGRWLTVRSVLDRESTSPEPPAGEVFIGQIGEPLTGTPLSADDQVLNTAVETMTATIDLAGKQELSTLLYVVGLDDESRHGPPALMHLQSCLDVTGDGVVNVDDVMQAGVIWRLRAGDAGYDSSLDLNANGQIDVGDISRMTAQWGTTCTTWQQRGS